MRAVVDDCISGLQQQRQPCGVVVFGRENGAKLHRASVNKLNIYSDLGCVRTSYVALFAGAEHRRAKTQISS